MAIDTPQQDHHLINFYLYKDTFLMMIHTNGIRIIDSFTLKPT